MYIDFETYRGYGGEQPMDLFTRYEPIMENVIDKLTYNRWRDTSIRESVEQSGRGVAVMAAMAMIIDLIPKSMEEVGEKPLTAFSNGSVHFTYSKAANAALILQLDKISVALPQELTYRGVYDGKC